MVKELMHDPIFLAGKSEVATKKKGENHASTYAEHP